MSLQHKTQDGSFDVLQVSQRLITQGNVVAGKIKTANLTVDGQDVLHYHQNPHIIHYNDPQLLVEGSLTFLPSNYHHTTITANTTENKQNIIFVLPSLEPGQVRTFTVIKTDPELGDDYDIRIVAFHYNDELYGHINYSWNDMGGYYDFSLYMNAGYNGTMTLMGVGQEDGTTHWSIVHSIGEWFWDWD